MRRFDRAVMEATADVIGERTPHAIHTKLRRYGWRVLIFSVTASIYRLKARGLMRRLPEVALTEAGQNVLTTDRQRNGGVG